MTTTTKTKYLSVLALIFFLILPCSAYAASFDEYGTNENACIFVGTLENWDGYLFGQPPQPYDPNQTNTIFLIRKWSKSFDDAIFQGEPWVDGAWCKSYLYQHLSGNQEGWTWHNLMRLEYSSTPIEGAIPVDGIPNLYLVTYIEWLTDPDGNETVLIDVHTSKGNIPLHEFGPIKSQL